MELILKLTDDDVKNIISLDDLQAIFKSSKTVTCKADKEVTYDVEVTEEKVVIQEDVTEEGSISADEFKAKLVAYTKAGKKDEVKATLTNFGYKKISDVNPSDFEKIIKEISA